MAAEAFFGGINNLKDSSTPKFISLLTHMDIYFQMASLEIKRKMLGSIFPGKLVFQDGKYRTRGMNPALELILQKTSGIQKEKTGNILISGNVSGDVPRIGLEPTHLTAPEPKSGVSTNFTIWAGKINNLTGFIFFVNFIISLDTITLYIDPTIK